MNYRDASGTWQKVDTTMRTVTGGWSDASNPAADVVAPSTLGAGTSVGGTGGVRFVLRGAANVAGTASGSEVRYPGAYPGVDVLHRAVASGMQELLTIDGPTRQSSFTTDVLLPAGATLRAEAGGAVVEQNGVRLGTIPAPVATDAQGVTSPTAATLAVSGSAITVGLDPAWAADPSRAWPVVLDPDYYAYGTSATIESAAPTTNFSGTGSTICTGWSNTSASSPQRGIVTFSTVGTVVPPDAEIIESVLGAHVVSASPAGTVAVYPLTRKPDTSSVTWNQAATGLSWTTAGGDFTASEGDNPQTISAADATNTYHHWHVNPAIVQTWLRTAPGHTGEQTGFLLKAMTASPRHTAAVVAAALGVRDATWVGSGTFRDTWRTDQGSVGGSCVTRNRLGSCRGCGSPLEPCASFGPISFLKRSAQRVTRRRRPATCQRTSVIITSSGRGRLGSS